MNHEDQTGTSAATRRRKERHRAIPLLPEVRHFDIAPSNIEVRSAEGADGVDEIVITGYPIVYDQAYLVRDMLGEFEERIHAGSLTALLSRGVDCRLLLNHQGLPMARTTSGFLTLSDTPGKLAFEARLDPRQQVAKDFAIAIERRDITQMSVGMVVGADEWGKEGGRETRDIYALADLRDVSGVTYPCSETTSIEIAQRMALEMPVESRARVRRLAVDLRAGRVLSTENQDKLVEGAKAIHAVLSAAGLDPASLVDDQDADDSATPGAATQSDATSTDGQDASADGDATNGEGDSAVAGDMSGVRGAPATAAERRAAALSFGDQESAVYQALLAHLGDDDGDCDLWVCDLGSDWVVYQNYMEPAGLYRLSYSLDDDNAVTFAGDPERVAQQTAYVPVDDDTSTSLPTVNRADVAEGEAPEVDARTSRALWIRAEARKLRVLPERP